MSYVVYIGILALIYFLYMKRASTAAKRGTSAGRAEVPESEELAEIRRLCGSEIAKALGDAARLGQTQSLSDIMQRTRAGAWDVRESIIGGGSLFPEQWLRGWAATEPQSTTPLLLLAACLISEGFKARGHGASSSVTNDGARVYDQKMAQAEETLKRVAEMDPEDPTPHARLVVLASYQSLEEETARARLTEALRREPDHFGGIKSMTHFISPYWNGSKEQALAFGREMSSNAPEGTLRAGTIITSYVTIWHQMHFFEKGANKETIRKYLADPSVQAEIRNAYARSVASPNHRPSQWSYVLLNQAAGIFTLVEDRASAADALSRIGDRRIDNPWEYLGDPAKNFAKARKWAGVK